MQPRHGIGLRTQHFAQLLAEGLSVGLVEAISENFMGRGGRPLAVLERVRRDSPVVLHGVSLSIGGLDPIPDEYLRQLAELRRRVDAAWVSDHFSFGSVRGHASHDLWPLPFTEETVRHVVARVQQVQDALGQRLVLENVSSYVEYASSELTEWEFVREVAERADCELLLDVNNVYVNAVNHGFDAKAYLAALPSRRIRQLHLAGHLDCGTHLFDHHGAPVADPVWALYRECVRLHGPVPTIIEWDEDVPSLERVLEESARAGAVEAEVLAGAAAEARP
ncbi:MAG: DUF692 domain-containing protein [Myxococcota bacterium]